MKKRGSALLRSRTLAEFKPGPTAPHLWGHTKCWRSWVAIYEIMCRERGVGASRHADETGESLFTE